MKPQVQIPVLPKKKKKKKDDHRDETRTGHLGQQKGWER
jgi:hypothetical protein